MSPDLKPTTVRHIRNNKSHELDHITEITGVFGRFHGVAFFVIGLTIILHTWQQMVNKFYTYKTEHWCARPDGLENIPVDLWLNLSAPIKESGQLSRCRIFNMDYQSLIKRPDEVTDTIPCTSWEYATEPFDNTIIKRWNLVCGNMENFPRYVQIVFFVGNMVGMLMIGPFSDWFGRKRAYLTCLTLWSIVTLIGYFVENPYLWIVTRFLCGVLTLAYRTATDSYRVELTSGHWRSRVAHWGGELWWQLGHLSLGLLVYLIPNMKHLELFIGLSAIPFLPLWFLLPESPRWLLSQGRINEAKKALRIICKWNKRPLEPINHLKQINFDDNIKKRRGTILDLVKYPATRRNILCMVFSWLAFSMGYFGLVYNTPAFDWNIYLVFVFPTFITIPITISQPFFENRLGRKPILTFSLLTAGLLLVSTIVAPKGIPVIVLAWIGTTACSVAFGNGYTFSKELFPTPLRTTALGLSSAGARVGSLLSPFIAMLDSINPVLPLGIYGAVVLVASIVTIFLWPETKRTSLPETLEEAERIAATKNRWTNCSCCRE